MQSAHAVAWSGMGQEPAFQEKRTDTSVLVVFKDGPDFVSAEKRLAGETGAVRYFGPKRWESTELAALARYLKKPVADLRKDAAKFPSLPARFWLEVVRST